MMRKILSALTLTVIAGLLGALSAAPASALTGSEQLGCYVTPSPTQPSPTPRFCSSRMAASSYSAAFEVLNESGAYSYAWTVPADYTGSTGGCTSATDYCILYTLAPGQQVPVSVTISQDGQSATLRAVATINSYCGGRICKV